MKPSTDIINRECDNKNHVHLYQYREKAWIAYGRSAINLNLLLPNIGYRNRTGEIGMKVMVVDWLSLEWLLKKISPESQSPKKITLNMTKILQNTHRKNQ